MTPEERDLTTILLALTGRPAPVMIQNSPTRRPVRDKISHINFIGSDPAEMLALYGFLALGSHFGAAVSGENSQFSPDEVRTYTAAISTSAARTLIDKISVAVIAVHNQTGSKPEMNVLENPASSDGGDHYREVAGNLRLLARQCRFPNARKEMLDLAIRYEHRGHHFDTRAKVAPDIPDTRC